MSTTTTDPIADMLTRIRNAINVQKNTTSVPYSKIKLSIAQLLQQNNFIDDVKVEDLAIGKLISITINNENSNSRISNIKRLSRPGRREYINAKEIPIVKRGRGLVIISTSKGLMTGDEARDQKIGGELICQIY